MALTFFMRELKISNLLLLDYLSPTKEEPIQRY